MNMLKIFLVDDEELALKRLTRILGEIGGTHIVGQTSDPREALDIIPTLKLDALFLDIQMPELSGFELLEKLERYPPVVFTTAYDEYALRAFDVYSIDYLLKPVETEKLQRTLKKIAHSKNENSSDTISNLEKMLADVMSSAAVLSIPAIDRLPSRSGGRIQILNVREIVYFFSEDKLTFAKNIEGRAFPIDFSLQQLETKLDPKFFLRVHRGAMINLDFIREVHGWFSGRVFIQMKDNAKTEIVVARDRVRTLKDLLGL